MVCVYILRVIGGVPGEFGYGYYWANIVIFVIIQPSLIVLFFLLWRKERHRNKDKLTKKISYIDDKDNLRPLLGVKGKENA